MSNLRILVDRMIATTGHYHVKRWQEEKKKRQKTDKKSPSQVMMACVPVSAYDCLRGRGFEFLRVRFGRSSPFYFGSVPWLGVAHTASDILALALAYPVTVTNTSQR